MMDFYKSPYELVAVWRTRDGWLQERLDQKPGTEPLSPALRSGLVRFLEFLCRELGLATGHWFSAVLRLDIWCANRRMNVAELPSLCAACVAITRKLDRAYYENWMKKGFESYLPTVNRIAAWLRTEMPAATVPDASEAEIGRLERRLLRTCHWILPLPSSELQATTFWTRFNVLTDGRFDAQLQSLYSKQALTLPAALRWLALCQTSHAELTPGRVACGLLCQGIVLAGILPVEALVHRASGTWPELFRLTQFRPLPCPLPREEWAGLLTCLEESVGCELATIREDCETVAAVLIQLTGDLKNSRMVV